MLVNQQNLRSLYTAYSALFQSSFAGVTPTWNKVAMSVPSTTRANEYGWLGQFPRMREWLGDRVIESLGAFNYTIRNRTFESTIAVKREDIEDDNIGIYNPMFEEFGRASATFPDELVYAALAAGFTGVGYDGRPFFDASHPVLAADGQTVTTVSNTGGGAGTPWFLLDTSRAIKPLIYQNRRAFTLTRMDGLTDEEVFSRGEFRYGVDGRCNVGYGLWQLAFASRQPLTAANYGAARAAMMGMRGDRQRPLGIRPNLLVVPPPLEEVGLQILNADVGAAGATNVWRNTAELHVAAWLS